MNEKFDEIIGRLAAQEPVLEDGEALTEKIMADIDFDVDIDRLTQNNPTKKTMTELGSRSKSRSKSRIFLRTFTSAAAVLLIIIYLCNGFFFGQTRSKSTSKSTSPNYEQCIAKYKSDYSFLEGATDLREAGARYLAKKRSHESVINYLKNKHYEAH